MNSGKLVCSPDKPGHENIVKDVHKEIVEGVVNAPPKEGEIPKRNHKPFGNEQCANQIIFIEVRLSTCADIIWINTTFPY